MGAQAIFRQKMEKDNDLSYWKMKEISKLVTPIQNKYLPVYRWYNYKHSFSRNLVLSLINELNLSDNDVILDPFCGTGTTLLASKEMGIPSVGLDIMPLSVLVSNVKIGKYNINEVRKWVERTIAISKGKSFQSNNVNTSLLAKYFPKGELGKILILKETIQEIDATDIRNLLLMGLLSVVENASYTRKDGAFFREVRDKTTEHIRDAFLAKMGIIQSDLSFLNGLRYVKSGSILSDARRTPLRNNSISAVITSPPYPNRHDYTRIYFLELMIGFFEDYNDVKALRYNLLRSHVEAKERYDAVGYEHPKKLKNVLNQLELSQLPNRTVINLVDGYFKDIHIFLKEMARILKRDGTAKIVIGDARYGGIKIPTGDLLIKIAADLGLEPVKVVKARDKGNSPQQMGRFGKKYSPENIITLEKR